MVGDLMKSPGCRSYEAGIYRKGGTDPSETDRNTDTHRQADRQTDTYTYIQRETQRHIYSYTYIHTHT